jgi:hypothetical protein
MLLQRCELLPSRPRFYLVGYGCPRAPVKQSLGSAAQVALLVRTARIGTHTERIHLRKEPVFCSLGAYVWFHLVLVGFSAFGVSAVYLSAPNVPCHADRGGNNRFMEQAMCHTVHCMCSKLLVPAVILFYNSVLGLLA